MIVVKVKGLTIVHYFATLFAQPRPAVDQVNNFGCCELL